MNCEPGTAALSAVPPGLHRYPLMERVHHGRPVGDALGEELELLGARRVFEILDAPVEVKSAPDAVRRPRLAGEVEFERVAFAYGANAPVLRDINLRVGRGQCVAILGATGAGKSVLMSLVPRFFDPTAGRVLIDGRDARTLHLDDLRRDIGLVFQESFLFSNTVAANIAFGHPEATRAQIEQAARIAAAHDFIMALPQGYDTLLGERGTTALALLIAARKDGRSGEIS